ncbi:energy-coupling factor transporter transmembrane protein EcfT [Acetivibrio sp. MSJd-27]|jgi:cobalt transport protein|uniref:energy-coupling factor transporter transmembrane component T family protein n=1 Tax=Acetivibrio sp. MSJd-27 TaxID=2841523 RepID=UPI0015AF75CF|nr:energy-coupling factor transporter transmembrane component T [Acetivibrio sp. MSJd-27]MBU5449774.1 energy-coupling factor transporter transmembrane protein EcfT [Acetivibrio sp. MSJd-27]
MLKDITLGQYYPADSVVHKLDSRTKILITLLYMVMIFVVDGFIGFGVLLLFNIFLLFLSKIPAKFIFKGLKPILFFVVFTVILNMFMTDGKVAFRFIFWDVTYEGIFTAVFMALRIIFLVIGTSFLTYTTSPITLTDGIERLLSPFQRIGVPAHELAMMMSIALRFIPTLIEETDKIMKAQKARGADFETGSLIKRGKNLVPILVPLFISAFRRAEDLATAMEARCYNGGENRTRLKELKYTRLDAYAWGFMLLLFALILIIRIIGFDIRGF